MAGIAGIFGPSAETPTVDLMLDAIAHRGSDTRRTHAAGTFAAGVGAGTISKQRGDGFAHDDDGVAIFLDGELFNGHPDEISDAEFLLELYRKHGRGFAAHADGVFACAIFDGKQVILARDPVGVRPIYWGFKSDGSFCFASEIKSLVGQCDQVSIVPAAATVASNDGLAEYPPKWPDAPAWNNYEQAVQAVRRTLTEAVQRRLDDGAVDACLLSGGLDSSIIASIAYSLGARLPLVTVGVENASDIHNARIMADYLDGKHYIRHYNADDVAAIVPRAVRALESFDEDCVSGAIANLFASEKATEFGNCILSGEGGDELFGGYHLLKDLPDEAGRAAMMRRLIAIAHNTALQRLDRAMFANGIHYRTPFLDGHVISLALQLPVRWKICRRESHWIEKYILREAFRDMLPVEIYRREKLRFSGGTGTDDLMEEIARRCGNIQQDELPDDLPDDFKLSSPREAWYLKLFEQNFPGPQMRRLVARWDPFK